MKTRFYFSVVLTEICDSHLLSLVTISNHLPGSDNLE